MKKQSNRTNTKTADKTAKITISVPLLADKQIRRQAFNEGLTLGELVLKYREAWFREQEQEKEEKAKINNPEKKIV